MNRDALLEEVVLTTSIYVRQLCEIFPSLTKFQVTVYDYEGEPAGQTSLKQVGDLMAHNRYIAIRNRRIVDLMSDKKYLAQPQTGLQLDFIEYLRSVSDLVESITVERLATVLRERTRKLSPSSRIGDIVFLMQNLYTLGGFMVQTGSPVSGPVRAILDRLAPDLYEQGETSQGSADRFGSNNPSSLHNAKVQVRRKPRRQEDSDLHDRQREDRDPGHGLRAVLPRRCRSCWQHQAMWSVASDAVSPVDRIAAIAAAEALLGRPLVEDCTDPATGEIVLLVVVTDNGPAMKSVAVAR